MTTYDEAMNYAIPDGDLEYAAHWLNVAREIREAAENAFGIDCPAPHFAVQDVEAEVCSHRQIVVRLPGASLLWWHAGQRTWCDGPQGGGVLDMSAMPSPARATPLVSQAADTAVLTLHDVRKCFSCGLRIAQTDESRWMHIDTTRVACAPPDEPGAPQTYAWPAAQE